MKTSYDQAADIRYLRLTPAAILESEEVAPGVVLDFDSEGRVVAIELLNARQTLAAGASPVAAE